MCTSESIVSVCSAIPALQYQPMPQRRQFTSRIRRVVPTRQRQQHANTITVTTTTTTTSTTTATYQIRCRCCFAIANHRQLLLLLLSCNASCTTSRAHAPSHVLQKLRYIHQLSIATQLSRVSN